VTVTELDRQTFLTGTRKAVVDGTRKVEEARLTLAAAETAMRYMTKLQAWRLRRKVSAARDKELAALVAELRDLAGHGKKFALISDAEFDAAMSAVEGN